MRIALGWRRAVSVSPPLPQPHSAALPKLHFSAQMSISPKLVLQSSLEGSGICGGHMQMIYLHKLSGGILLCSSQSLIYIFTQ